MMLTILAALFAASVASTAAVRCDAPPATGLDLSGFAELQLPVDLNGGGKPTSISGPTLASFDDAYFERQGATRIVMRVPRQGLVHTAHSRFPRSELKEGRTWSMTDGCATLSARVVVQELPDSGDVVIGQIHQQASIPRPPVELHFTNGRVYAAVLRHDTTVAGSPRDKLEVASGIAPGQAFSYGVALASDGRLTVEVDGHSVSTTLDPSFAGSRLYFKAGAYVQDENGGGAVAFDGLRVTHASSASAAP